MTGPLYIAEQLPNDWRGPMTVCNQLLITIGILVGSIVAGIFEPIPGGWRYRTPQIMFLLRVIRFHLDI